MRIPLRSKPLRRSDEAASSLRSLTGRGSFEDTSSSASRSFAPSPFLHKTAASPGATVHWTGLDSWNTFPKNGTAEGQRGCNGGRCGTGPGGGRV